jgi:hypothetical protein
MAGAGNRSRFASDDRCGEHRRVRHSAPVAAGFARLPCRKDNRSPDRSLELVALSVVDQRLIGDPPRRLELRPRCREDQRIGG